MQPHEVKRPDNQGSEWLQELAWWWRLVLKECRETLRDRRTILTLVLMPLLTYPLLGAIVQRVLLTGAASREKAVSRVAIESLELADRVYVLLRQGNAPLIQQAAAAEPEDNASESTADALQNVLKGATAPPAVQLSLLIPDTPDARFDVVQLVREQTVDVGIRRRQYPESTPTEAKGEEPVGGAAAAGRDPNAELATLREQLAELDLELVYDPATLLGDEGRLAIERAVERVNQLGWRQLRQRQRELPLPPARLERMPLARDQTPENPLAAVIPLILILMTVTGAVYPAIDLTAGERERGTLEALIAAPVSPLSLLSAKYVAVLTVALLTAIMNLMAMFVTAYSVGLDRVAFGKEGLTLATLLMTFGLLSVFAAFFSAVLLALTTAARSFKEAQSYLIPLMLVAMAPGIMSLLPGIELSLSWSAVPIMNLVLVTRELLGGTIQPVYVGVALVTSFLYAAVALSIATRLFGADAVLSGGSAWNELWEASSVGRLRPNMTQAWIVLATLVPCYLLLSSALGRIENLTVENRLVLSAVVTATVFAGWPWLAAGWFRLSRAATFSLSSPATLDVVAAVILGCSLWPLVYEIETLAVPPERLRELQRLFGELKDQLRAVPLVWKWITLAITPAICEELFFRGFLLSAARSRLRPWLAVLATGVLFGVFHVLVRESLLLERLLPTAILGVILGWVCWRTGSIWPGILLHVLHNGLLLALGHFESELNAWTGAQEGAVHLPSLWLLGSTVGTVCGVAIIARGRPTLDVEPALQPSRL